MLQQNVIEADGTFDAIAEDARARIDAVGNLMAEKVRDDLSVNVQRVRGKVIRSKPGEHPRHDSGRLFLSIEHETELEQHVITVTVSTDTPYAPYLENGTQKMAIRPIFAGVLEDFEDALLNAAHDAIEGV